MCSQSFLRALGLAALLAAPMAQAALADPAEQQAMHQTSGSDENPAYSNGAGYYDTYTPPNGD